VRVSFAQQLSATSPLSLGALTGALGDARDQAVVAGTERMLAKQFAADDVVLVDSGRAALQLALDLALVAEKRRLVALPAFQCFEVASAAIGARCEVTFYDVDPATLSPDLESLDVALRAGARAVVVAPLYGVPVAWDAITTLVDRHGAMVIEDAAQGLGASWRGRPLGTLGPMSVVSFGRGKGWTGGGGGALCVRGKGTTLLERSRVAAPRSGSGARAFVNALMHWTFGRPALYGIPASVPMLGLGETRYHAPRAVTRAASFSAALVARTSVAAATEAEVRRRAGDIWRAILPQSLSTPTVQDGSVAGYLRFPVRVARAAALLSQPEARAHGVAPSYPIPLTRLPELADRVIAAAADCRGADALARELVTLPTHSRVTARDRDVIVELCAGIAAPSARDSRAPAATAPSAAARRM